MPEPRFDVDLMIRVFGMDANHRPFSQEVHARNISEHGAKFSGLETQLALGDIIGAHFGARKARCEVMNVEDAGALRGIEVGVRLMEGQTCPWQEEVGIQRATADASIAGSKPVASEKRRFPRQRISFPVEIRDHSGAGMHMRTNTSDIAGSGCYIETRMPLPVNHILEITFWLNSEPVHTSATVRTCDGGVGMGIEFTGLDEPTRKRLQQHVEAAAAESSPFATDPGSSPASLSCLSPKV
jgi:hypothetical protein